MPTSSFASFRRVLACCFLVVLAFPVSAQNREVDLGVATRRGAVDQIPVWVQSGDAALGSMARRALNYHGGLRIVADAESARQTIRLSREATTVRIQIGRAAPTAHAASRWQLALLEALDEVCRELFGTPGLYAASLAFVSDRSGHSEVYLTDLLFSDVRQLTRDRSQTLNPHLSPDGRRLIYTGYYRSGSPDLHVIDLGTLRRSVFVSFKGTNTGGVFSPDGRSVALSLSGVGNAEVYLANPQGREIRRLTRQTSLETDPDWSPNGRELVITSDAPGRPQLYRLAAREGATPQRIRTQISGYCAEGAWNPVDRDQIAFTAAQGREFEIALYRFSEGSSRVLTQGRGDAIEAAWLGDGRHLIYTERTPRSRRLVILDTVTGQRQNLSPADFGNAWQADLASPFPGWN